MEIYVSKIKHFTSNGSEMLLFHIMEKKKKNENLHGNKKYYKMLTSLSTI